MILLAESPCDPAEGFRVHAHGGAVLRRQAVQDLQGADFPAVVFVRVQDGQGEAQRSVLHADDVVLVHLVEGLLGEVHFRGHDRDRPLRRLGPDQTGADRVGTDPGALQLLRQRFGQFALRGLEDLVRTHVGGRAGARHEHERARIAPLHLLQETVYQQDGRLEIDAVAVVPFRAPDRADGAQMQHRGIVEDDVRTAVFPEDEILHRGEAVFVRQVDVVVVGHRARNGPQGRFRALALLPVVVQDDDLRTHRGETPGGLEADASPRPGDQHHLAVQRALIFLDVHRSLSVDS